MSLDSVLLNAMSGLRQTSLQLSVASQNVANAGTAGYSRKTAASEMVVTGGVRSQAISRDIDQSLRNEANAARTNAAAASLRGNTLSALDLLQGDPADGNSLGSMVAALRNSFTTLSANPSDTLGLATTLQSAKDLAGRMNEIGSTIGRARQTAQDGLRGDVDSANELVRQIAKLDQQVRTEIVGGRSGADLQDQRDAAVAKLSQLMGVTPVTGQNGGIALMMRDGRMIPMDWQGNAFSLDDSAVSDSSYYGAGGTLPGLTMGGTPVNGSGLGGRIGEGFTLRDETLPAMQAELDMTAATLAHRLDEQGLRLFTDGNGAPPDPTDASGLAQVVGFASRMKVNTAVADSPRLLRDGTHAVGSFTPNPADGPSGFTALTSNLLNFSFGTQKAPGVPHAAIATTGLGPGGNLSSTLGGSGSIVDHAAKVTAGQAGRASTAEAQAATTSAASQQFSTLLASREGVDVDAEMATMVTLQNAYAANARVMSVAQNMWDALLAAVR